MDDQNRNIFFIIIENLQRNLIKLFFYLVKVVASRYYSMPIEIFIQIMIIFIKFCFKLNKFTTYIL